MRIHQVKGKPGFLARYVPILNWLTRYRKEWLAGDTVAGLSVWALMLPQCLGFAAICSVPVQYGLYAAAIALIVYAILANAMQRVRELEFTAITKTNSDSRFFLGLHSFYGIWRIEDCPI